MNHKDYLIELLSVQYEDAGKVITQLRELASAAEREFRTASKDFESLRDMLKDASHANSSVSLRVLQAACSDKADVVWESLDRAFAAFNALAMVSRKYKEKLGPRAEKPKDCPGQMDLFVSQDSPDTRVQTPERKDMR